jgi:hypothetical protein
VSSYFMRDQGHEKPETMMLKELRIKSVIIVNIIKVRKLDWASPLR